MYMMLGIVTTVLMSFFTMASMESHQVGIAAIVLGVGTYVVFTFGRLHGLKEIK